MKKIAGIIGSVFIAGSAVVSVFAASPDGLGPWADTVVTSAQGLRKDGSAVPAGRSDPTSALGVAENDTVEPHFFSLGFKGSITLGFDNGISSGAVIVEATNAGYPAESANVEMSSDGTTWYLAGSVIQDGKVAIPREVSCVKYVRITDTSNPDNFTDGTADGYDVDGVEGLGQLCGTEGRMTGGGSVFTEKGTRVTHGFELHCSKDVKPNNLEVNWDKGNNFHLESLTFALCVDDPKIEPNPPKAGFDTYIGEGTGKFNGVGGYKARWVFTDAGEPGSKDFARLVITDPSNVVVLAVSGNITKGNQQAH